MDIIISGNDEVIRMIREIPVDRFNRIDGEKFMNLAAEIANERKSDEV